jgi:hypothetical protein
LGAIRSARKQKDSETTSENRSGEAAVQTDIGVQGGQLYLLYHADRFFCKYEETARFRKMTIKEGASAMNMYFETGQIRKNFGHRGRTLSSLHNDKIGAA